MTAHAWFSDSFRKSHILYVSPEWARDRGSSFDADALVGGLAEQGVDALELYCKDHHGNVYYPSAHGIGYPRDVVGETIAACRRHGVRFIAYVSICFDEHSGGLHKDWRHTDVQGRARVTGPFSWLCLRSPYRDVMLAQIEELAAGYDIEGLWMDIIPIAHPSPYTNTGDGAKLWMLHDILPCYCHWCRTQFREETGRSLPLAIGPEDAQQVFEFGVAGNRRFIEDARAIMARHRPGALVTYNGAGGPGDAVDLTDIVSIEGHAPWYERQDLIGRWARGRDLSFEIMSAGALPTSPGGWNGLDRKPDHVLRLEAAIGAAHGGTTIFGHAPFSDGHSDPGQFAGLGAAFRPLEQAEPAIVHPRSTAEVLLAATIRPLTAPRAYGRSLEAIEGWSAVLRAEHVQFDVAGLDHGLSPYRLVIVADQQVLADGETAALRRYVEQGGALLVTGESSLLDEHGRPRPELALADLAGVATEGRSGHAFTYLTGFEASVGTAMPGTPVVVNRESLRVRVVDGTPIVRGGPAERPFTDATTILWGYPSPDPAEERVLGVTRSVGSGRVTYLGVALDHEAPAFAWGTGGLETVWTRRLAGNLVRSLLGDPLLVTDAPAGVVMVLNQHPDHWALHLLDLAAGDPRYVDPAAAPRATGTLCVSLDASQLPVASAAWADGRPIAVVRSGGRIELRLEGFALTGIVLLHREAGDPA